MGFNNTPPIDYDRDYWAEYLGRDVSEMGQKLTEARVKMVERHFDGPVVDIGIGGGRFVSEKQGAYGYDINEQAVQWLKAANKFRDPYANMVEAITCWDSLEHIPEPHKLLNCVKEWLFVSIPIFESAEHCLGSRHYKPGEHLWYFTDAGFVGWCEAQGFELIDCNMCESDLGRDGIYSYAFKRVKL